MKIALTILTMALTTLGFCDSNDSIYKTNETKGLGGDFRTEVLVNIRTHYVGALPSFGVHYSLNHYFSPQIFAGVCFSNHLDFIILDAEVKTKFKEETPFYITYGVKSAFTPANKHRQSHLDFIPSIAAGVEIDGNKYYQLGFLLHPSLIRNGSFSITTGVMF